MLIYENIRLALSSLKANKMRALLTMLGIIIGISSVIAIMTVGNSVTHQLTDSMSSLGVNNINVGIQMKEDKEAIMKDIFFLDIFRKHLQGKRYSLSRLNIG